MFFKSRAVGISLAILMFGTIASHSTMAQTQSNLRMTESLPLDWATSFFRPPKIGVPDNTGNGSSRDELRCPVDTAIMRPLLPQGRYGFTSAARPKILVEIPETSAQKALLVFRNETGTFHQFAQLPVEPNGGIAEFQLPEGTPEIAADQTYQWSLSFICGEYYSLNDPTVIGWINRPANWAEFEHEIAGLEPVASIERLGENGYWYDLVQEWSCQAEQTADVGSLQTAKPVFFY